MYSQPPPSSQCSPSVRFQFTFQLMFAVSTGLPPDEIVTCKGRCFEVFDEESSNCRCDQNCHATNSCCSDFQEICMATGETPFHTHRLYSVLVISQ